MHLGTETGNGVGSGVRTGQTEDLVAGGEQLRDGGRTDPA